MASARKKPKTSDNFFLGFPSYWNITAFYLYVLQSPPWINAFVILLLSILVFVPIKYIYPSRSPRFRALTNSLGSLWGLAVLAIIYLLPEPPRSLILLSLLFPAYYAAAFSWLELLTTQVSDQFVERVNVKKRHRWFLITTLAAVAQFSWHYRS